ncbi:DUF4876 domain-containing protein [Bacteroides fluxus]|uniref:DUF4876 domain-containing protein n=1 Tax=Bacteroides fluxus TaxID=626930 RepID=UPI002A8391BA|nr:DUF4876 domain-containing protein [Bacteroides fluxus]MDY3789624.1 DUF4876 domain-containing protein [Bacteroides fluxus]
MKKYTIIFVLTALALVSCEQFREANDAENIAPISVSVKLRLEMENLTLVEDLLVKFDNYNEGLHLEKGFRSENVQVDGIVPGIYTISVSGMATDREGGEYYLNGNLVNRALFDNGTSLELPLKGLKISPLVFKEIYYAGSRTPLNAAYFRDQFYEIYNNSAETQYLDGIYFANLTPGKATTSLPLWPEEDGDDYVYAERVWKFPGNGKEYPLASGESCVIAQFAANHKLQQYNPDSPVDCSSSEFEFNMNNPNFPDQPATDMVHVFYNGKSEIGRIPQYLTSVFGGAYVLFKVAEGDTWDPVNDLSMKTTDLRKPNSKNFYAKIPVRYVLDAVEAIDNESMVNAKRIPAVLDAGLTYVGATYCGLGVARKPSMNENGEFLRRENGALIFQDGNNSTDDFEKKVVPELRRYGTGMPSWNHSK